MRIVKRASFVAVAGALLLLPGCSTWMARAGTDIGSLPTRSEIRAVLGAPDATGREDGDDVDSFHTRRPIDDRRRANRNFMTSGMSAFLAEPVLFLSEVAHLTWTLLAGRDLKASYDPSWNVRCIEYDGEDLWLRRPEDRRADRAASEDAPP